MKLYRTLIATSAVICLATLLAGGVMAADEKSPEASPAASSAASPAASPGAQPAQSSSPGNKSFTLVAVMLGKSKFWMPATIIVEQGDHVKLTLRDEIEGMPNQHGFSIPDYNITELVTRGEPKTVEFTADKVGVFPFTCQVHPAHIGGQLEVHPKGQ